jgi:adenosine deaminase
VDLAGYENITTRAHHYRDDFRAVHRCGLALTIHAGENDDAEGIWSAVFDLNARRVGHALSLGESPDLLRSFADRRIGIEMCPYANLQIKGFPLDAEEINKNTYPLLAYLNAGIPVTVNTDNIGISAASLTENFLLLSRLCPGITRLQILQLLRNALDQSFLSSSEKSSLLAKMKITH